MFGKKQPESKLSDRLTAVEKHIERLGKLTEDLAGTTELYVTKSLSSELGREAEAAGKAVKKYIEAGGDPQKVADFYNVRRKTG